MALAVLYRPRAAAPVMHVWRCCSAIGLRSISTSVPASHAAPAAAASKSCSAASAVPPGGHALASLLPPHQVLYASKLVAAPAGAGWTPASRRTGVLALKCGMTCDFDVWGQRRALTVLKLEHVLVTHVHRRNGVLSLSIGSGVMKPSHVNKPAAGIYAHLPHVPAAVREFRVTPDALLPVGAVLDARHFVPGQRLRVSGTSQGKGFQGVMKRHNFAGQGAAHGNSLNHRTPGSTGCRQDPGRVAKGKAMPGHMGVDTITVEGLRLYKVDIARQLLYVEGCTPGKPGTLLEVTDSAKRGYAFKPDAPPPFPTYAVPEGQDAATLLARVTKDGEVFEWVATPPAIDPFAIPENEEAEAA